MSYLSTQPVKGFRDFYPDEMAIRNWLFGKMRTISRLYGYQEYDGPVVESVHLYEAKSGEELVKDQTFQMQDKGGRQLALRPEMTPSLARMVAAKQQQLIKPVRWFTIGPRFRYEAPQKGRAREFYQWDIDCLGYSSPLSDAEIIAITCHFFEEIGLTHNEIVIKINNRKLMDFKLSLLEIPLSKRPGVFRLIDKRDKMTHEKWRQYAHHIGLSDKQLSALTKLLTDRDVAFESEELTEVFSTLKDLGFSRFVEYDPSVVRGLEYYTGTVFEARDRAGKFRAILGGGRYDNLVELFSQQQFSGIGFACGDMVLMEILEAYGKVPDIRKRRPSPTDVLVTLFDEPMVRQGLAIAHFLRKAGIRTEIFPDYTTKLARQLKYADAMKIPYAIIIGPDEQKKSEATIKKLADGSQQTVKQKDIVRKMISLLV